MLVEVKVKVARIVDNKTRKRVETCLTDVEIFANAELRVMQFYSQEQSEGLIDDYEIQSLKISPIKEVATQFNGQFSYVATLKDIWLDNDGSEKALKYKVLLWADNLTQANTNVLQLVHQGYDMQIEGIKQVDYEYLEDNQNEEQGATS